ncbi:unnamed protein product [Kluyveromyces dobzhanskii CBS 2104]|uniref:Nuclear cap-binding protein complex subunit 1 n=1 Tax=Kluyveromyces dobzhanskii CBS 2104 TaxID=1427455 RepID=A0A0A8LD62_9SACH|nr:unnamed protein product [Kluyveromyces dobzhanskii CBS 2104]
MILADYEEESGYREARPHFSKRQRLPPVVMLCKDMMPDIRTMGESAKAFPEDIKFLSEAIVHEFGNEEYFNNALLKTFRAVVLEQPHKQPGIALLTMVLNSAKPEIGKSVLNYFFDQVQALLNSSHDSEYETKSHDTGPWDKIKLILRFISILSPMVIPDDLIELYRRLLQFAIDINNSTEKRSPLSEAIYTNTLLNIPYLFYFNSDNRASLKTLVEDVLIFVENDYKIKDSDIELLKAYNKNSPYEPVHWVTAVLPNVKDALANEMQQLSSVFLNYDSLLTQQTTIHSFNEPLNLPTLEQILPFSGLDKGFGSVDSLWKTPRYSFEVYLPNSVGPFATVIPTTTYTGMLFQDILLDIIESMEFNRLEVARQLVTIDLFFAPGIFTEPGLPVAQLLEQFEENHSGTTFKIEDLAVGAILQLTFKLPTVSQSFAYFYSLLVEICKNSPKAIAPVFGRAFRFFYNNLDKLDFELKARFLDWFSIQMGNFNFSWKWNEWETDSVQWCRTTYNPRVIFIKNLIRKELRLTSNSADVEESVTDEFQKYMDPSFIKREDLIHYYSSLFKNFQLDEDDLRNNELYFRSPSFPFYESVINILDFFHKQPDTRSIAELENILKDVADVHGSIIEDFNRFTVTLLIQAIVFCGSRSLSHANKYIDDSREELKAILAQIEVSPEVKDQWICEAVIRYWNKNSQNGYLILDSLRYNGLVSSGAVLNFSLTEQYGVNMSLVDSTSIESIFRILNELAIATDKNVEPFEYVFNRLVGAANDVVSQLNTSDAIVVPDLDQEVQATDEELPLLDLAWKYESIMGFLKSILRKYSDEFSVLTEKTITNVSQGVTHEPTKQQLNRWILEAAEL